MSKPIYVRDTPKNSGWRLGLVIAGAILLVAAILQISNWWNHHRALTLPSTAVVDTAPRMDPVGKSVTTPALVTDETENALRQFGLSKSNSAKISVK